MSDTFGRTLIGDIVHSFNCVMNLHGQVGLDFTPWLCKSEEDKEVQKSVLLEQVNQLSENV